MKNKNIYPLTSTLRFFSAKRSLKDLKNSDLKHVIHPYASLTNPSESFIVDKADGCHYYLKDGNKVIDGMSSWWAAIHGYNNKFINKAIEDQLSNMSHIMFGGLSHEPAIKLCEKLVNITPSNLQKVFLCDSGSVSIEVALKLALQYWYNLTKSSKKAHFLTIRNGYHGDTFGAMSVCDPDNGMHSMFKDILPQHYFVSSPSSDTSTPDSEREAKSLQEMEDCLKENSTKIAAVIMEPIVQGAGGMKFYSFKYLKNVRELCDKYETLLILDEIATGFGRTGKLFACEGDNEVVQPDILCLGKALSAGYITSGATLVSDKICKGISNNPYKNSGSFMHGPTFMGNPLTSAICLASISLLENNSWKQRVTEVEVIFKAKLLPLKEKYPEIVENIRVKGAIGVVELKKPITNYLSMQESQEILITNGVWLRPFGKLLYSMPPFNTPMSESDLIQITTAIENLLMSLKAANKL